MNSMRHFALRSALAAVFISSATNFCPAATNAFDDTAQAAYDDGWQTGDNGGVGWGGGWVVNPGGFGTQTYFTGDSDANGSGAGPGIDTPTAVGRSWGIRASNSPQSQGDATRAFGGALAVGQTLRLALDHGLLAPGPVDGVVGFGIRSGTTNVFEFLGTSLSSVYLFSDQSGFHNTTVPLTTGGVDIRFKLTGPTAYSFTISNRDGSGSQLLTGTLASSILNTLRVFNFRGGNAIPASDAFFNSIAIVSLPCDYNGDGEVNAADYVVWRKYENTTNPLTNDLIGGEIGHAQYDQWRAHFGESVGNGAHVGESLRDSQLAVSERLPHVPAVPEPHSIVLLLVGVLVGAASRAAPEQGSRAAKK